MEIWRYSTLSRYPELKFCVIKRTALEGSINQLQSMQSAYSKSCQEGESVQWISVEFSRWAFSYHSTRYALIEVLSVNWLNSYSGNTPRDVAKFEKRIIMTEGKIVIEQENIIHLKIRFFNSDTAGVNPRIELQHHSSNPSRSIIFTFRLVPLGKTWNHLYP